MHLAILSDVHGNLIALDAVLRDIRAHDPFDQLVVAGDLAWGGPRPGEVIDRLAQVGALGVMGNMDAFMLGAQSPIPTRESQLFSPDHPVSQWMRAQLNQAQFDSLRQLPFSRRFDDLLIVHANPHNLDDAISPETPEDKILPLIAEAEANVIAFGHVHVNYQRTVKGIRLVDVASAGLPTDGDTRAAWDEFVYQDGAWQIRPHRVEYDVQAVVNDLRASGRPEAEKWIERLVNARY
jgi:predicted phosphodiesterase